MGVSGLDAGWNRAHPATLKVVMMIKKDLIMVSPSGVLGRLSSRLFIYNERHPENLRKKIKS
jgi:hypothetical protein